MNEYKIEKGIPLPRERHRGFGAALDSLEIGDSFVANSPKRKGRSTLSGNAAKRKPKRFVERRIDDEHVRIWRVE